MRLVASPGNALSPIWIQAFVPCKPSPTPPTPTQPATCPSRTAETAVGVIVALPPLVAVRQGGADVAREGVPAGQPEPFDLVGEQEQTAGGGPQVGSGVGQESFRPPSELRQLLLVEAFVHAGWRLVRNPARISAV